MIHLTPVLNRDLGALAALANNPEVKHAFGYDVEFARPEDVASLLMSAAPGTTTRSWTIIAGERIVGCISLANIHPTHRRGEITNRMVAPDAGWMVGLRAVERVARIGFMELNLHRIECLIHGDNRASMLLCQRLARRGLRLDGVHRQSVWRSGEWRDIHVYAILRADYQEG